MRWGAVVNSRKHTSGEQASYPFRLFVSGLHSGRVTKPVSLAQQTEEVEREIKLRRPPELRASRKNAFQCG